ncbi:MAG: hypothetical protein ACO1TE_03405 [Prosthecobacter sp.]
MSRTRSILRMVIIAGCAVVGAAVGVCFQALRITGKPQEFRSVAKLVAAYPPSVRNASRDYAPEDDSDFEGTILETVESDMMKQRALERVRALHPELQEREVLVRATKTEGTGIFNVQAVGAEPRYTQVFLDALLEEFTSFRQSFREQGQNKVMKVFLEAIVDMQKRVEDSFALAEKARSKVESLPAKAEQERLVARLSSFRNQRDDLRSEIKALAAGEASRATLESKMMLVEQEIQTLETATNALEQAAVEFRIASEKHAQAKLAYEKMFDKIQEFQTVLSSTVTDLVVIQERASPAVEQVEDWRLPVALGAAAGGLLGALAGFFISLALSGPASLPPVPPKASS